MSEQMNSDTSEARTELPIEKGFPIELVNDISERENYGGARQHYRPCYTMHKWWAPRTGAVFRTICLYSLLDNPEEVTVREPGTNGSLSDYEETSDSIADMMESVSMEQPDSLWPLYGQDTRVSDKRVLDPFMGGGTSIAEASRFGADVTGNDLNPVAWFTVKKIFDGVDTDLDELKSGFEEVEDKVSEEILKQYRTSCPNEEHDADVISYFWAKELDCTSCGDTVGLFNDYRVAKGRYDNSGKYNVYCPECESVILVDDWRSEQKCGCGHSFVPEKGTVSGSNYTCRSCGQKYGITDAVQEQNGYDSRLYAIEYYCEHCDEQSKHKGYSRDKYKGYKSPEEEDFERVIEAENEWEQRDDLNQYVPDVPIRPGWKTASSDFDGKAPGAGDLAPHGIENWDDMFNTRQLLCLSKLLKAIDEVDNDNVKEYLLLAFSDSLRLNSMMTIYHHSNNQSVGVFKTNSFDPPMRPLENNLWGTKYGSGTFKSFWKMVVKGVKYAQNPTERILKYPTDQSPSQFAPTEDSLDSQDVEETEPFRTPLDSKATILQGDARNLDFDEKFDAVITDPPYYHNILYSELSDYFYVWQKLLLQEEYDCFQSSHTPRKDSIVANPAENKGEREFEDEIRQAFKNIRNQLVEDGVLAFTYHHSDSESWGEVLEALCDVGFEVTATYPVSADLNKLEKGESVSFDIVIVARPRDESKPISWNSLRRNIVRTATRTRKVLEESRSLSRGDIGVIEMGRCFQEYSKHHNEVRRDDDIMSAKEVVGEIYGIIQEDNDLGEIDVYLDLLNEWSPTYNDLNKLCRGTNATPESMKEMRLFQMERSDFSLNNWDNEKRQAYVQNRVGGGNGDLTPLDKAHYLRYCYENDVPHDEYLERWHDDELENLCEDLAEATRDETYLKMLRVNTDVLSFETQ